MEWILKRNGAELLHKKRRGKAGVSRTLLHITTFKSVCTSFLK
jgi:hypothetical protein